MPVITGLAQDGAPRRADAGGIRLSGRDVAGLLLCAEHYAAPYDLLAGVIFTWRTVDKLGLPTIVNR